MAILDSQVIIKVYIEDVGQHYVEVPITPNTSCQDVVDCTKEPGRESGYIVVIKQGTEHILSYNDNIYSLLQLQGKEKENLVFVLHYGSVIYQDDMADLPSRS
ncbi:hypothetical protein LOTGIDRAFT_168690 [Lottia gigantea]|uniref:Ras association domain-containing protein n=1 Tax=Lottia gigantea TaxID=225164 RepID=V3ZPN9_LOTGI|nr:hypothetical protein LOTGIDRAFT_168690 [Lottia gigantea]ESO84460.1 hypothetical protein LOTGIDRAFT_168690 [Lottia gigantea]